MSSDNDERYTPIAETKLRELMRDHFLLENLLISGVDNWDEYFDAKQRADKEFKNWENENGWR